MRYSDFVRRSRAVFDETGEILLVGPKHLEQLRDLAASTAEATSERPTAPSYNLGYADGVTAVLDWLVTGKASTELADLLELQD